MSLLMSVSFKPTTFNTNMYTVQTSSLFYFKCLVSSFEKIGCKNFMSVVLSNDDRKIIFDIESIIQSKFDNYETCLMNNTMHGIKIPTQYNIIQIPFKTVDGQPVLVEHIVDGLEIVITLSPTKVICKQNSTICTWLCKELIANIKYT